MNRRDRVIIAEVTAFLVVALSIALAMLEHATGSGSRQWALGFGVGAVVALLIVTVVGIVVISDAAVRYTNAAIDRGLSRRRMTARSTGRSRAARPRPAVAAPAVDTAVADRRISADTETRLAAEANLWRAGEPAVVPPVDPAAMWRPRHAATIRIGEEYLAEAKRAREATSVS